MWVDFSQWEISIYIQIEAAEINWDISQRQQRGNFEEIERNKASSSTYLRFV